MTVRGASPAIERSSHPTTGVRCYNRRHTGIVIPGAYYCGTRIRTGYNAGCACGNVATRKNDDGSFSCPYHWDAYLRAQAERARKPSGRGAWWWPKEARQRRAGGAA